MNNDQLVEKMAKNLGADKPDAPKKLTREQLRYKERVEKAAMFQLNHFASKFYEFFMENDPESEEVAKKRKELSAKWKMYCHQKGLSKGALELLDSNCQRIIDEYKETMEEDKKDVSDSFTPTEINNAAKKAASITKETVLESAKEDKLI